MSFKTNDCQQLSLDDSFTALTEREKKKLLEKIMGEDFLLMKFFQL